MEKLTPSKDISKIEATYKIHFEQALEVVFEINDVAVLEDIQSEYFLTLPELIEVPVTSEICDDSVWEQETITSVGKLYWI